MIMFIFLRVILSLGQSSDPHSFDEAVSCSNSDYWFTRIQQGLKYMHDNYLVHLLDDFKPIGCNWFFQN